MLAQLHLKNIKGWENTGPMRIAPITVVVGSNSSGKTSLPQSLSLLKQTAESTDRSRVLHTGDDKTLRALDSKWWGWRNALARAGRRRVPLSG